MLYERKSRMYESLSDAQLLEKLYTENYSLIYRLVVHTLQQYVRTSADAADLTQEVFITAARKIDVLRDHPNPTGWLISTAYYQCKNHVRSISRRREVPDDALILTESDGDAFASSDIRLSISQILGQRDYALLVAYCMEKRPAEEICREYGLSPAALRVRIHRLRKILSTLLVLIVTFDKIRHI